MQNIIDSINNNLISNLESLLGKHKKKIKDNTELCYGSNEGSLHVVIEGEKKGSWYDFQTSKGGKNFIDLMSEHENISYSSAISRCKFICNIEDEQIPNNIIEYFSSRSIPSFIVQESSLICDDNSIKNNIYDDATGMIASSHKIIIKDNKKVEKGKFEYNKKLPTEYLVRIVNRTSDTCYICEGVETALSIAHAIRECSVACTLSTTGFSRIPIKNEFKKIIFCFDNDLKPWYENKMLMSAIKRLENVFICVPDELDNKQTDFNDVLQKKGVNYLHKQLQKIESFENFQFKQLKEKISNLSSPDEKIYEEISNCNKANKDILRNHYITVFKKKFGEKISKKIITELTTKQEEPEKPEKPEWCKNFVYVNSHDKLFGLKESKFYSEKAFDYLCGGLCGEKSASTFLKHTGFIDVIYKTGYSPESNDKILTDSDGDSMVNLFVSRPKIPKTLENEKLLHFFLNHLKLICNFNEKNCSILENWIAWQVQHFGEKITWAPIIQGIQGIGKSSIGVALSKMLGERNVKIISAASIMDKWNEWACNSVLNVLEEIRIKGQNRFEITDKIKPLLTDIRIDILERYSSRYNYRNCANYICFTNYKDAIPLDLSDRRWWVIFCDLYSKDKFKSVIKDKFNLTPVQYIKNLKEVCKNGINSLLYFFSQHKISDEFMDYYEAPETEYKLSMIQTERSKIEGLSEIEVLLKREGGLYCFDCFAERALWKEYERKNFPLTNRQKRRIHIALDMSKYSTKIRISGNTYHIWTRSLFTTSEIKERLLTAAKKEINHGDI